MVLMSCHVGNCSKEQIYPSSININRKNINTNDPHKIINKTKEFTHHTQTDILVGLQGKTYQSHLNSLDNPLPYGTNCIFGGEIQTLPEAGMDKKA